QVADQREADRLVEAHAAREHRQQVVLSASISEQHERIAERGEPVDVSRVEARLLRGRRQIVDIDLLDLLDFLDLVRVRAFLRRAGRRADGRRDEREHGEHMPKVLTHRRCSAPAAVVLTSAVVSISASRCASRYTRRAARSSSASHGNDGIPRPRYAPSRTMSASASYVAGTAYRKSAIVPPL